MNSAPRRPSQAGIPSANTSATTQNDGRASHTAGCCFRKEQPCERQRVRRGAATRVTSRQADRSALHPWSHEHPGAGAESLGMRGSEGTRADGLWLRMHTHCVECRGFPDGERLSVGVGRDSRYCDWSGSPYFRFLVSVCVGRWDGTVVRARNRRSSRSCARSGVDRSALGTRRA